jgi:hypothetical protein
MENKRCVCSSTVLLKVATDSVILTEMSNDGVMNNFTVLLWVDNVNEEYGTDCQISW